jgi:hypothetical protein
LHHLKLRLGIVGKAVKVVFTVVDFDGGHNGWSLKLNAGNASGLVFFQPTKLSQGECVETSARHRT